jgi:L-fuculose-phosphate aldolase
MSELALRTELIDACRALNRLGLSKGTSGNISVRYGDGLLISPTGIPYGALRPEEVVRMNWDGSFSGAVLPSSEWRFHRDVLAARPDLNAIVHTHSTHATTVGILNKSIPAIHYAIADANGDAIPCAPYATFGTQELAAAIVTTLGANLRACLLAHHGVIAAHVSIQRALALAVTIEELAQQYLLCLPLGEPPVLEADEIARVIEKFKTYGQQTPPAGKHLRRAS